MSALRPYIVSAKERLSAGRAKLQQRHQKGSPGVQVCRALTELVDGILVELFEHALRELFDDRPDALKEQIAIVAMGGYGRGDVAPYSDVDLMILHHRAAASRLPPLAERLVRDVYDVGFILGQSVRTPQEACELALGDATIFTTLVESRLLCGSAELFADFQRRFSRMAQHNRAKLITDIEHARAQERSQYGETVYLLEPNVKRSPGALRDLQLLRWIGYAAYGTNDPDTLKLQGHLWRDDHELLQRARDYLLRLRNEMHFAAQKPNDQLDRGEQLRLSTVMGFEDREGLLAVEQFMSEYFRLTQGVQSIVTRFMTRARPVRWWRRVLRPLIAHQFERDFLVGPQHISVNRHALPRMGEDLSEIVRLCDIANLYDKSIAAESLERIRPLVATLSDRVSSVAAERFISLLQQPARLGEMLRHLYDLGVLERLVPHFRHARGLLQFNAYHKFTVDEHSLRAVEAATAMMHDTGPLGTVYRQLKRKWLLHLALLLHDLGKGFVEDHSDVGLRIAADVAERLQLDDADAETLKFLVHKHLHMSHLAFRRDTSDNDVIVRFAVEVGSVETLEMLFLLSAADLAAVGPGTLNAWKIEVLADLFHRTMRHLSSDDPTLDMDAAHQRRRDDVLGRFRNCIDFSWYERQVAAMPGALLRTIEPQVLADDLEQLRPLTTETAFARGRYQSETGTVEYRVGTYESITPGIFHKLTGALTSQGLQILSAEIITLSDGLVFDRFSVQDPDFRGEPPLSRIDDVCRSLTRALQARDYRAPVFRRLWGAAPTLPMQSVAPLPTRVLCDNSTSDRYTILDIFAANRMGLLYTITHTLFELGLSVAAARIGTYLDQVVDVFYVTDQSQHKLEEGDRLNEVRRRLLDAIANLEQQETERARGV